MRNDAIDENFLKTSRLVLCPHCDKEARVSLEEEELLCESCNNKFEIEEEYGEDFIWHPERKF